MKRLKQAFFLLDSLVWALVCLRSSPSTSDVRHFNAHTIERVEGEKTQQRRERKIPDGYAFVLRGVSHLQTQRQPEKASKRRLAEKMS